MASQTDDTAGRVETRDPLPSWSEGKTKRALLGFVERVTAPGSPDFVAEADRIAAFDHEGTLWPEQPVYTQLAFAFDRVRALAPGHPEWRSAQPFQGVLEGDLKAVSQTGERGLMELLSATHVNNTPEEFERIVKHWMASARHPQLKRPYPELVYQPMLELLRLLRANGFRTFIVTGGGVEFLRPWVEAAYGIPPEQVIGSRVKLRYVERGEGPVLLRLPEVDLFDDRAGKVVGLQQVLGRRPLLAVGNSDGDFEMLEWTTRGPGARLGMLVHHTDTEREFAYDRSSRALDEAPSRRWVVVDMKQDWKLIYPFQLGR